MGFKCHPFKTGACKCLPDPPLCQNASAPVCGGTCPAGYACKKAPGGTSCQCYPCFVIAPADVGEIFWASKGVIVWPWGPCADWYNVYKSTAQVLPDMDRNGLADFYGACFQPEMVENQAPDSSSPPAGNTSFYLVTGENPVGEGSMGYASNGLERRNTDPCP